VSADYEIICLDENGGISRAIQATYSGVDTAIAAAAASAPEDCSRIMLCATKTNLVVWEGTREDALKAAGTNKNSAC
jgi:hypothetical protein